MKEIRQRLAIKPAKGSQIIEAVRKATKEPVVKENNEAGFQLFELGQDSMYWYENFKLVHPTGMEFDPDTTYDTLIIMYYAWPTEKYALGFTEDAVIEACESLKKALAKELA